MDVGQNRCVDSLAGHRVALVSRIFAPEPGAASLRLGVLARRIHDRGASMTVYTSSPPRGMPQSGFDEPYEISRAPVLRDRAGYVRGYVQYLSFDLPALFRVLTARRFDAIIVEPPPTTGLFIRIAASLRRTPYHFFAADVWSEAAAVAGSPAIVVRVVRAFERFVYAGARSVFAVSPSVADRVNEVCPTALVHVVGNGFDAEVFRPDGDARDQIRPYLLYAGTASEVHGAAIFVEALRTVVKIVPDVRVVFIGQGSDREAIAAAAAAVAPGAVEMLPRLSPEETAEWIRGAHATLASMRPGGYDAFPTKIYASIGCGVPVIYAGGGAGRVFAEQSNVGWAVNYDALEVAEAMVQALQHSRTVSDTEHLARWAHDHWSMTAVADRIVDVLTTDTAPLGSGSHDQRGEIE